MQFAATLFMGESHLPPDPRWNTHEHHKGDPQPDNRPGVLAGPLLCALQMALSQALNGPRSVCE